MATAPASANSASSEPAAIAHTADRPVAHHMNEDAAIAQRPETRMARSAVNMASHASRLITQASQHDSRRDGSAVMISMV